jgi:hypothetical protein
VVDGVVVLYLRCTMGRTKTVLSTMYVEHTSLLDLMITTSFSRTDLARSLIAIFRQHTSLPLV